MGLYKQSNSKNWMYRKKYKGKWFRKSTGTPDRKEAEKIGKAFEEKYLNERNGVRQDITVHKALDIHLKSKEHLSSHRHYVLHASHIKDFFYPGQILAEVSSDDLDELVDKIRGQDYSDWTVKHILLQLHGAIGTAKRKKYFVPDIEFPKIKTRKGRTRVFTDEELLAIENALKLDDGGDKYMGDDAREFRQDSLDVFYLLRDTGARFAEITGLPWKAINLNNRTIHLYRPKVDNESILHMTDAVYETLKRRHKSGRDKTWVFPGRYEGPLTKCGALVRAIKRAGIDDGCIHTIRHTVATRLLENGMDIEHVRLILGHADIKTTLRYVHAKTQDVSKHAADILSRAGRKAPALEIVR